MRTKAESVSLICAVGIDSPPCSHMQAEKETSFGGSRMEEKWPRSHSIRKEEGLSVYLAVKKKDS